MLGRGMWIGRFFLALAVVAALLVVPRPRGVGADSSESIPGPGRALAQVITAGGNSTCVVTETGAVKCWGSNSSGQLGQGDNTDRGDNPGEMGANLPAVDLGAGRTATAITAGTNHTCALLDNDTVKCWGNNVLGQLGQGDANSRGGDPGEMGDNLPTINLSRGGTATAISTSGVHTCALLHNGTVKCWGYNLNGGLGQGHTDDIGDNPGEMGNNLPPIDLGAGRTATAITAGDSHTCALLDNSTVKCWGDNSYGQLGQGTTDDIGDNPGEMGDNLPPVDLGAGRTATAITAGSFHTCALLDNNTVKCWGYGSFGGLGYGDSVKRGDDPGEMGDNLPAVDLGAGRTATAITAGSVHTCALLDNSTVKCWGDNSTGQLGQGDTTRRGDDPGEMGDNLLPIDLPAAAGAWIACHSSKPTGYWLGEADGTIYPFGDADTLGSTALLAGTTLVDTEATPTGCGYWTLRTDGAIEQFGDAPDLGDFNLSSLTAGEHLASFSPTPTGQGLWAFTDRGRVLTLGDAKPKFAGAISDLTSINLAGPIIDSIPTPSGEGYYMLGSDGGVFAFGDATFAGSLPGLGVIPNQPTVGLVPDP
ncbi:MAG TPA: hypothetical protein ENI86_03050, partial [Acidimicrobiales bacterium]|nr:hypothetical protein [Acidimicrobiales bacterium]